MNESFLKSAEHCLDAFRKLRKLTEGGGFSSKMPQKKKKEIEELRKEAAIALGAIDDDLTTLHPNRTKKHGDAGNVDIFHHALTITDAYGSGILNDAVSGLQFAIGKLQAHPEILHVGFKPTNTFESKMDQAFVIMKFGDPILDSAFEGVIKPILGKYQIHAKRIDEVEDSGRITDQILEYIRSSRFVIADLTGERPNCYYETGYAHAFGKEMILTIKANENIHFDLAGYRFLQWNTEQDFREKIDRRVNSIINEG